MEALGKYILSVTLTAVAVGILSGLLDQKSGTGAILRLIGGVIMTLSVIRPMIRFDWNYLTDFAEGWSWEGESIAARGAELSRDAMTEFIKEKAEAYILDKAAQWDARLQVSVSVSDDQIPVPVSISISGSISPYGKGKLRQIIESDLGIPKERQIWTGTS